MPWRGEIKCSQASAQYKLYQTSCTVSLISPARLAPHFLSGIPVISTDNDGDRGRDPAGRPIEAFGHGARSATSTSRERAVTGGHGPVPAWRDWDHETRGVGAENARFHSATVAGGHGASGITDVLLCAGNSTSSSSLQCSLNTLPAIVTPSRERTRWNQRQKSASLVQIVLS